MDDNNALLHVNKIHKNLLELVHHLREDIDKIDDIRCKALFETSAEVLLGLSKAFEDYANKNESAWR